jgi:hypothetical protein
MVFSALFAKLSGIFRCGMTPLQCFHGTAMYNILCQHLGIVGHATFGNQMRLCQLLEGFGQDSAECFRKDRCVLGYISYKTAAIYRFEELRKIMTDTGSIGAWGDFLSCRQVNLDYAMDDFGITPLMSYTIAHEPTFALFVALFLGCGANVAATNYFGSPPLHHALRMDEGHKRSLDIGTYTHSQLHITQLNIIRLLITAGADVYAFNGFGWSPLDQALHYSTESVFFEALDCCGISREDYIREHDRRKADWNRFYGAKSTAVDTEFLESPPRSGLIKRRKRVFEEDI